MTYNEVWASAPTEPTIGIWTFALLVFVFAVAKTIICHLLDKRKGGR